MHEGRLPVEQLAHAQARCASQHALTHQLIEHHGIAACALDLGHQRMTGGPAFESRHESAQITGFDQWLIDQRHEDAIEARTQRRKPDANRAGEALCVLGVVRHCRGRPASAGSAHRRLYGLVLESGHHDDGADAGLAQHPQLTLHQRHALDSDQRLGDAAQAPAGARGEQHGTEFRLRRGSQVFGCHCVKVKSMPPPSTLETSLPNVRLDTSLELLFDYSPLQDEARVLATVVATAGSTYRKAGARMLILANGGHLGLLSGGCLEADLKEHADEVLRCGIPRAVEYDMRGPDDILFGIGAGCEGAMRVLLEPAGRGTPAERALQAAGRRARAGLPTALVAVHECADLPLGTYTAAPPLTPALMSAAAQVLAESASREVRTQTEGGRTRAFVQYLAPAPHLLICGGGPDAQPVVANARGLGWRVTVVEHRPVYALGPRFPGAGVKLIEASALRSAVDLDSCHAAVVMSHHLLSDAAYLRELALAGGPAFVGLLGPAARRERLARELGAHMAALQPRLRGPVGIDLGAVTPEGIALAIVSQIHAWLAGRAGSTVSSSS